MTEKYSPMHMLCVYVSDCANSLIQVLNYCVSVCVHVQLQTPLHLGRNL